jgi:hypothetical protein
MRRTSRLYIRNSRCGHLARLHLCEKNVATFNFAFIVCCDSSKSETSAGFHTQNTLCIWEPSFQMKFSFGDVNRNMPAPCSASEIPCCANDAIGFNGVTCEHILRVQLRAQTEKPFQCTVVAHCDVVQMSWRSQVWKSAFVRETFNNKCSALTGLLVDRSCVGRLCIS